VPATVRVLPTTSTLGLSVLPATVVIGPSTVRLTLVPVMVPARLRPPLTSSVAPEVSVTVVPAWTVRAAMVSEALMVGLVAVLGMLTVSVTAGAVAPLQLPATNQSVDTAPVQVRVTGPAGVAVAAKVAAATPIAVALKLCAPTAAPSLTVVAARPLLPVTTVAVSTVPPPVTAENVTGIPLIGRLSEPRTSTVRGSGRAVDTVALWASPLTLSNAVGDGITVTRLESLIPVGVTAFTKKVAREVPACSTPLASIVFPPLLLVHDT
jgi:hypothetical protein